jgi:hypothetical protein
MPRLYYHVDGMWRTRQGSPVSPVIDVPVDPSPDPTPASWQQAVDDSVTQQSWNPITDWYTSNTGHEALGYAIEDLTPGTIVSSYDGQVFEGISASVIRVSHNNVTIRGCRVVGGGVYGVYLNPTFNAPVTGLLIEYCTLYYGQTAPPDNKKSPMHVVPAYTAGQGHDVTISHCNAYDWSAGIGVSNKVLVEYCYIHDFQHPEGVHANSIRPSHIGGTLYRNYGSDGRSGVMSIYFDKEPTHSITIEENIMTGLSPLASPSYLINLKDGDYSAPATNIKIINNMYGPGYQYGIFSGTPDLPWGSNGNECTGNRWLMTGELTGNQ